MPLIFSSLYSEKKLSHTPKQRRDTHYLLVGGEAGFTSKLRGSGIFFYGFERKNFLGTGQLRIYYNTDKLGIFIGKIMLGIFEFSSTLEAEALFAQTSHFYYQRGKPRNGYEFASYYLQNLYSLKWEIRDRHYLDGQINLRGWWFDGFKRTDNEFLLPVNHFAIEQSIHYTFWGIHSHRSLEEWHWPFWRIAGIATGLKIEWISRTDARSWGSLEDRKKRNKKSMQIGRLRQWLKFGVPIAQANFRFQLEQFFAWGLNEDDITRDRLGGLNPYSIPLAGMPWSAFVSENYLSMRQKISWKLKKKGETEMSFFGDVAVLHDPRRSGDNDWGAVTGIGVSIDGYKNGLKWDIALGWAPAIGYEDVLHIGFYASMGKKFERNIKNEE